MPTDREMQIVRLLDAGVALRHRANQGERFGAVFDFDRIPKHVLRPTLVEMLNKKLLQFDKESGRYHLTEQGRQYVAVRQRVRDFALTGIK